MPPAVQQQHAASPSARPRPPTLAIAASDGTISLYDLATESVIGQPLRGHGAGARAVAYSADGHYLATTADDGLVGLWGDNGGDGLLVHPTRAGRWFNDLSSDGSRMLVAQDGVAEIRDAHDPDRAGVPVVAPAGLSSTYQFTRFSADGRARSSSSPQMTRRRSSWPMGGPAWPGGSSPAPGLPATSSRTTPPSARMVARGCAV